MQSITEARAFPGRGLEGDRYFAGTGFYSKKSSYGGREVTLIEIEAVGALFGGVLNAEGERFGIKLAAADTRRNIATSRVPLNHLVDREFWVGAVRRKPRNRPLRTFRSGIRMRRWNISGPSRSTRS
jgi:hypothetical protein